MTAAVISRPDASAAAWIRAGAVVGGLIILMLRPAVAIHVGWTVPVVVAVFTGVLLLGVTAPVTDDRPRSRPSPPSPRTAGAVLAAGALVFAAGRVLAAGHSPVPATGEVVALNTFAAVAEEALFRRVAFAALLPAGPVCAIVGSALLFGLAHVTVYGWWAFPVDVGAGLVFGWQRWVSGRWAVPAATHALADLLVVI